MISDASLQEPHGMLWVLMITSAGNRGWNGDVAIPNLATAGLPAASVIRTAKIATIAARDAEPLGKITARVRHQVWRAVAGVLRADSID